MHGQRKHHHQQQQDGSAPAFDHAACMRYLHAYDKKTSQTEEKHQVLTAPEVVEFPSFDCSKAGLHAGKAYLEQHGYAVFTNVLSKEEIEKAEELFWDYIEGIPERMGMDLKALQEYLQGGWPRRGEPSTWDTKFWPADPKTGIIWRYGAGQSPFSWYIRTRPKVKAVFSAIWETDDLLTSFDGFNVFRPWQNKPEWKTQPSWFHLDQNAVTKPGGVLLLRPDLTATPHLPYFLVTFFLLAVSPCLPPHPALHPPSAHGSCYL